MGATVALTVMWWRSHLASGSASKCCMTLGCFISLCVSLGRTRTSTVWREDSLIPVCSLLTSVHTLLLFSEKWMLTDMSRHLQCHCDLGVGDIHGHPGRN